MFRIMLLIKKPYDANFTGHTVYNHKIVVFKSTILPIVLMKLRIKGFCNSPNLGYQNKNNDNGENWRITINNPNCLKIQAVNQS